MKQWLVEFRLKRYGCCGGKTTYWSGRTETVQATSAEEANNQILNLWTIDNHVEILNTKEVKNTQ